MMKTFKKNQSGFGGIEVLLIIIVIVLLGAAGWFVYNRSQNKTTPANTNTTPSTSSSSDASKQTAADANKGYLVIKEWGIKLKEDSLTQDAVYEIKDEHNTYLSTKTYTAKVGAGACSADGSTGVLVRGKAGYIYGQAPIENYSVTYKNNDGKTITVSPIKVGDYYYVWQGPQAPCASPTDQNTQIINSYQQALADLAYNAQKL